MPIIKTKILAEILNFLLISVVRAATARPTKVNKISRAILEVAY